MKWTEWITSWTIVNKVELETLELDREELIKQVDANAKAVLLIKSLKEEVSIKDKSNSVLIAQLNSKEKEIDEGDYWNNKRPKNNWTYKARDKIVIDPRIFWQYDYTLPTFTGTNDEIALKCMAWVKSHITYTLKDETNGEYWKFAYETLNARRGDCEDGSILMANMMLMSGIPYWRIRLNAGNVVGGGHAYVTYLKEKEDDWYVLDWCYWYNPRGTLWKNANKYYSDSDGKKGFGIWGSWNSKYMFGDLPKQ